MSNIFFTSDLHFWHANVIGFCNRPWLTVEGMNEGLIENWNSVVKPGDRVNVLGDFVFAGTTKIQQIMKRLNGNKFLILGNHDWKISPRRWVELGFEDVSRVGMLMNEDLWMLSHFPYRDKGDHTALDRYAEHRLEDKGEWLLHGHVHTAWKQNDRMINVGVDVWDWKPVAFEELQQIRNWT